MRTPRPQLGKSTRKTVKKKRRESPVKWRRGRGSRRAELIAAWGMPVLALLALLGYLLFRAMGLRTG